MATDQQPPWQCIQPVACMGCPKGPWRQTFPVDIHDWHTAPSLAPDRHVWCFWKAPGHSGQGPHWPSHNVQATEQRACDGGPQQGGLASQKTHISKEWVFTKFKADEFEDIVAEKQLILDGCGAKYTPNHVPPDEWWVFCPWEPWRQPHYSRPPINPFSCVLQK